MDDGHSSITDIPGSIPEKIKKRRRPKRKSQLEDSFPMYLQVGFITFNFNFFLF